MDERVKALGSMAWPSIWRKRCTAVLGWAFWTWPEMIEVHAMTSLNGSASKRARAWEKCGESLEYRLRRLLATKRSARKPDLRTWAWRWVPRGKEWAFLQAWRREA